MKVKPGVVVDRDRGWRRFFQTVELLRGGAYCKVGVLADDAKGGLHVPGGRLTVAEAAAVNEFGSADGHTPSRAAHRMTFDEKRPELEAMAAKLLIKVLDGQLSVRDMLGAMGAFLANAVKARITTGDQVPPPNAPSTMASKEKRGDWNRGGDAQAAGFGVRTLVDTARTVGAITWAVVMGGGGRPPREGGA